MIQKIRKRLSILSDAQCYFGVEVELDESYFGAKRVRGKRGRGAANEFARGKNHVNGNGIESFWSFAKRCLAKFNGLTDQKFLLHLKESEFRFNHR